ncbi:MULTISPECIES: 4-(cytidine 5'-diphospho)-2-C-methyl-D-erythritol kinase [Arthrobacter]|uniref:4-diphosphocytidyl-2-C-methyl-D-erythritol kinase n=2 Tax=Arthrobacter TaxID=1663 RepID=A0ABU9KKB9_9MICC|nr:4-(cytidine 5'-diphospho)-2-C-methyl-D-erythritol kinase [Arthrobacter sp. YJM1]MDP5227344.1 4-(cytidine 5'-diphospho)-2-C-methyl-D-erythritol kinase [Arthrobacter sp. YJM1]
MSRDTALASAPGKINVSLHVGPLREDGYHSLASVFLAVSLREDVRATRRLDPGIGLSVTIADGLDVDPDSIPLDERNLAHRAAALLAAHAGLEPALDLEITKRIPVAGGMAGGSADAAATLVACNELWGCGLTREELATLGTELGADVPFCLLGGAAVGLGVGDELTTALVHGLVHWVVVPAEFGLSTPEVFRTLDRLRDAEGFDAPEPHTVDAAILAALRSADAHALSTLMVNDLQRAAVELAPELRDVLGLGESLGALAGLVSGSGPTLAFLCEDASAAHALAEALRHEGHAALAVDSPGAGARVH